LGGAYQSSGKINEAIGAYKEFLSRFPQDDDVARVRNLIAALEKEIYQTTTDQSDAEKKAVNAQPPGSPTSPKLSPSPNLNRSDSATVTARPTTADYFFEVTRQGVIRWPSGRMPLRVFVEKGTLIPGYRPVFSTILRDAFLEWANVSDGLVSFAFVDVPVNADIVCRWTANGLKFQNSAESAETKLYSDRQGVAKGEIEILTITKPPSPPLTDERMRGTALHEVGHVLGLAGHTNNPDDIMFYSSSLADSWKDLSVRDKNTLIRLYSQR
jgi:predicted Zn-dependent protease